MESGKDLAGNNLNRAIEFCAGAEFFQTQIAYNLNNFRDFRQYARGSKVRILAGIVLLASAGIARHMNKNAPGIFVPDELIDELAGVEI